MEHAQRGHWDTEPFFLSLSFRPLQSEKLSLLHVLAIRDCAASVQIWPRGNRPNQMSMGWNWRTRKFKLVDYLGWLVIVVGTDMATKKLLPLKELLMSVIYTVPETSEQRNKKPKPQKINLRNSLPPKEKENWPHVSYWFRYPWSISGKRTPRRENYTG